MIPDEVAPAVDLAQHCPVLLAPGGTIVEAMPVYKERALCPVAIELVQQHRGCAVIRTIVKRERDFVFCLVAAHHPGLKRQLVERAIGMFYHLRGAPGLKKRPSTSELLDWLRLLVIDDVDPKVLEVKDKGMEPPPMVGALVKNEQDMQRIQEYLHAASKRGGRTW